MTDNRRARVLTEKETPYAKNKRKRNNEYKDNELKILYINEKMRFLQDDTTQNYGESYGNVCVVYNKKVKQKRRTKYKVYKYDKQKLFYAISSSKKSSNISKHYSMLDLQNSGTSTLKLFTTNSDILRQKSYHSLFSTKFTVNRVSEYHNAPGRYRNNHYRNPRSNARVRVFSCQRALGESECCCCNSDDLFEAMKSLYECYKRKNCDPCNCILCGVCVPYPGEGEARDWKKEIDSRKKQALADMEGKSQAEKKKILNKLAMSGVPLPDGRTDSEKDLINKVRANLGLPPEPKTTHEKKRLKKAEANGVVVPLEGKSTAEKERILKRQAKLGIELPDGRTASEKSLIRKVKASIPPKKGTLSEKMQNAKAEGLLTPLAGKPKEQKEKILRKLALAGIPLPEGKSLSEKKLIEKVRTDLGLPPEPNTAAERDKLNKAIATEMVQPLEQRSKAQKEKILQAEHELDIPLPEGRTPSEKALIAKVKAVPRAAVTPSERLRRAKAAGLLTPLEGKTPEQKEKILRNLAMNGIALPEGKTQSEKKFINKVRTDLGLPPEPKTSAERDKLNKAITDGIVQPLEGRSKTVKEKTLRTLHVMGISLPEGRTPSEKALISKIQASPSGIPSGIPSEKIRKAKAAGLLTPLTGKTPQQKEKLLRSLAMNGIPLPEGKTSSEKKLIEKVRADLGLPPEPKSAAERDKLNRAIATEMVQPLEKRSRSQKEKILKAEHALDIPLPEGRTPSEKALIAKVKAMPRAVATPSERMRRAKAAGLLTPLEGKTPEQKEKILRSLVMNGIALPEGKTPSEKIFINKIRTDLGLPPEPKTLAERDKLNKAITDGIVQPLEGRSKTVKETTLRTLHVMGISLPEGRTPSEKALISKIQASPRGIPSGFPSEKIRKAKAAGLFTPLTGKTKDQKEKKLRALAMNGIPLPEGKTSSERKIIIKVRTDLGLPPEPTTLAERDKLNRAIAIEMVQPLEERSRPQKEKILKAEHALDIPLPEGRTSSEKALIAKVKAMPRAVTTPSKRLRRAKAAGFLTPLEGKTYEQREKILRGLAMNGIPLPEGKTRSDRILISKVRTALGLPPEPRTSAERDKLNKAITDGLVYPLEGNSVTEKEKTLKAQHVLGIPLPEGRTASERALIAKIQASPKGPPSGFSSEGSRKAKAIGLFTPLTGKTRDQKEKKLRDLAMKGIPLPEGKTSSERKIIIKVRTDLGLPPEPTTVAERDKLNRAIAIEMVQPLEERSRQQKEKILKAEYALDIPLPEGRTSSEKALIAEIKAMPRVVATPSKRLKRAKAAGFLTPLEGKTYEQREKILRGLAMNGIPLPEGKTPSDMKLIIKVRTDLGLPPEPKTLAEREKLNKAITDGLVYPLEGISVLEKEKTLKVQHVLGIPLPEGRTPSEKDLIAKIQASRKGPPSGISSERRSKVKAAELSTPSTGKAQYQKEKKLRDLAMKGIPLPEGKTPSEKKLIEKIRADLGLPPEPMTAAERDILNRAITTQMVQPLEGKSVQEKERILKAEHSLGIPLPKGRTPSEKALIAKVNALPSAVATPSERLRKAKAAVFLLHEAKTREEKEHILRGLALAGIPLPEGKTPSEKELINKLRADLGLPPEPVSAAERVKYNKAAAAGILEPLEGKSIPEKKRILKAQHDMGISLPAGRTSSEKALIASVKASPKGTPAGIRSGKKSKAKEAGLATPFAKKTTEQKLLILKDLAMQGLPLPEGITPSEKKLINKVRADLGLPPEPKTAEDRQLYNKAYGAGAIRPLEGKSELEKEQILKAELDMGIPPPDGRTASEKALIAKIKAQMVRLTTSFAKKSPEQKLKTLKDLAMQGLPLPEGITPSERKLIDKVRADLGLPPEPKTADDRKRYNKAFETGTIRPLEGRSELEKEKILQAEHDMGIPLPHGRTPSEKALINEIKAKAAGLATPFAKKTTEQKIKILKDLAMQGLPLPEGITPSEKKLIVKVRADLGLPPQPKTADERQKYNIAFGAGAIRPLEGKSETEKEKILKAEHDMGVLLPDGRTPSEKALIAKVKAKAAGLATPFAKKTPEQKEKILKDLAMQGLPLPEGITPSEKKVIDKVRTNLGLPPEPKTAADREIYNRAYAAGAIRPLEGKSEQEKEYILKAEQEMDVPLPKGRTASEKALIDKMKSPHREAPSKVPSEKLRKAKAAGLFTPLTGKTPARKEKILRELATQGLPLPEGRTPSDMQLIDKVRADLGLPPKPKTRAERDKYNKAIAKGIIQPLEGKPGPEKEKILKTLHNMDIPLPIGRTPSEKAIIDKVKAMPRTPSVAVPSEKLRKAREAGLLTPLEGKTLDQKEKILRGLAMHDIPLPEGKTPSEKKLIVKVRADLGLPPEPNTGAERHKLNKGITDGIVYPLEGRSGPEKEKTLKAQYVLGIPLPEGRTPSEKALVAKIKASPKIIPSGIQSDKIRKAIAAGLATPFTGKTPEQKEKILRGLAMHGIPLPEGKSPSEKRLINKVRADLGLPPEPKSEAERNKLNKAITDGIVHPLEGRSGPEKEKTLKAQYVLGIPLPEGRTPSEKALIAKIKASPKIIPSGIQSEKIRKAIAAGLLTPFEGKSPEQKEKILKGLVKSGMPLPEGKTASEKKLIDKIRYDTGLPPEPTTPELRKKYKKAHAAGIITPLEGKIPAQKENILRKMNQTGIPLPEGRTSSERELIKKIRREHTLPIEPTPEKKRGKITSKTKATAGISEKVQDIIKKTTCDRACGCDKKKIRFKHSYVRIKVTSPDISSLCPCPDECVPGVKSGVFVDDEGIKVTVGSVVGFPSFPIDLFQTNDRVAPMVSATEVRETHNDYMEYPLRRDTHVTTRFKEKNPKSTNHVQDNIYRSYAFGESYIRIHRLEIDNTTQSYDRSFCVRSETRLRKPSAGQYQSQPTIVTSRSSLESILIVKTDSSLSLQTGSLAEGDTISIISFVNSTVSSNTSHYLLADHTRSVISSDESGLMNETFNYITADTIESNGCFDFVGLNSTEHMDYYKMNRYKDQKRKNDLYVFRQFDTDISKKRESSSRPQKKDPVVVLQDSDTNTSLNDMVNELLLYNKSYEDPSVYLLVPTSDEYDSDETSIDGADSTICILISENISKWSKHRSYHDAIGGIKLKSRAKTIPKLDNEKQTKETISSNSMTKETITLKPVKELKAISVDTMSDRPCCCTPKEQNSKRAGLQKNPGNSKFRTPSQQKQFISNENTPVTMFRVLSHEITKCHSSKTTQQSNMLANQPPTICIHHSPKPSVRKRKHWPVYKQSRTHSRLGTSVQQSDIGVQISGFSHRHKHTKSSLKQLHSKPVTSCRNPVRKSTDRHQQIGTQVSVICYKCDKKLNKSSAETAMISVGCGVSELSVSVKPHLPCSKGANRFGGEQVSARIFPARKRDTCSSGVNITRGKETVAPLTCKVHQNNQCQCDRVTSYEPEDNGMNKNYCECPPALPEPVIEDVPSPPDLDTIYESLKYSDGELDLFDAEGLMANLEMKSDITPTTSGLQFKFERMFLHQQLSSMDSKEMDSKEIDSKEMNFEDVIKIFEDYPPEAPTLIDNPSEQ